MQILVQPIPGQPIASLSLEQLQAAFAQGQLHPQARASRDGGATWLPLEQFPELSPMPAPTRTAGGDGFLRMLAPIGRSLWAVIAGYFGLGALFVAGFWALLATVVRPDELGALVIPVGISAIVLAATMGAALLGHRSIRRDPKKHGMGRVVFAYVCSGLLVVSVIAGLVSAS